LGARSPPHDRTAGDAEGAELLPGRRRVPARHSKPLRVRVAARKRPQAAWKTLVAACLVSASPCSSLCSATQHERAVNCDDRPLERVELRINDPVLEHSHVLVQFAPRRLIDPAATCGEDLDNEIGNAADVLLARMPARSREMQRRSCSTTSRSEKMTSKGVHFAAVAPARFRTSGSR